MKHDRKQIAVNIETQGSVHVSGAFMVRDYGDCVLVEVELASKYAEMDFVGTGDDMAPTIYFSAGENTLKLDDSQPRDEITVINLPTLTGFDVFCMSPPGRYTATLTFIREDKE